MRQSVMGLEKSYGKQDDKTVEKRKKENNYRNQVVTPSVEGVPWRVELVLKKYGLTTDHIHTSSHNTQRTK